VSGRIEEIRARLAHLPDFNACHVIHYPAGPRTWVEAADGSRSLILDLYAPADQRDAILAAPADLRYLLAELDRTRGEVDALEDALDLAHEQIAGEDV